MTKYRVYRVFHEWLRLSIFKFSSKRDKLSLTTSVKRAIVKKNLLTHRIISRSFYYQKIFPSKKKKKKREKGKSNFYKLVRRVQHFIRGGERGRNLRHISPFARTGGLKRSCVSSSGTILKLAPAMQSVDKERERGIGGSPDAGCFQFPGPISPRANAKLASGVSQIATDVCTGWFY